MAMVYRKVLVALSLSLASLAGCGSQQADNRYSDGAPDSTAVAAAVQVELTRYPDTTYSSAGRVKFVIDTFDRVNPGVLEDIADQYADAPGFLTFRGDAARTAPFVGKISGRPSRVVVDWVFRTPNDTTSTSMGSWGGGTGWTGQPLYVNWPDSLSAIFKNRGHLRKEAGNEEIIVASLARNVYFIDFNTGLASREPLPTDNPVKGTISLDPSLNGRLYVGQALHSNGAFGALVFDLFTHSRFSFFGRDKNAWRGWGAYDSSPVAAGSFIFRPGENGTLYKISRDSEQFSIHSTLRYKVASRTAPGIESSMAVFRNYGYIADNHGNILCINLDNLHPVWLYDNKDDTDATPVVLEEEGRPMVYVGSELDKQGTLGNANLAKLDALTGEVIWKLSIPCKKRTWAGKTREGGMFATILPGRANCSNLIFTNICFPDTSPQSGEFVAVDRQSGKIVYRVPLSFYAWSSPVAFVNGEGEMFVVTGDILGNIYLFDALTGELLFKDQIGANFESSPVVVGNTLVVGSRGTKIYKMHVE